MNWFMDSDHGTLTTPVVPRLRSPRRSRVLREVIPHRHCFSEDSDAVARPPLLWGPEEAGPPRLHFPQCRFNQLASQSSTRSPGTCSKSRRLLDNSVAFWTRTMEAILRSIVPMRTRLARSD